MCICCFIVRTSSGQLCDVFFNIYNEGSVVIMGANVCQDMYCTASKFVLWEIALLSLITGYRLWTTVAMLTLQPLLATVFIGTSTAYCWQVQFLLIVIKWRFILTLF